MTSDMHSPETIFGEAIGMTSPKERAVFLAQACGDDLKLRGELEKLVADHFRAGNFLESPIVRRDDTIDRPLLERPGATVGRYQLLQEIGEGGMGVVYMAEQQEPVRRKVALKVIKPGMDTREVITRFEAERQTLAMMDHPNVAHVLDAGSTDSGRPFFVMELVHGVPITEFSDSRGLTTRERLELFVVVCQAVQHAHQKGIIHRDIKPSNVMVTLCDGVPVPKIIDFGIAKATNQQLTDMTVVTRYGQLVGTPLYMSPEQAEMNCLDVDTRSDIYSLGVLLYELLTGATPFDKERLREAGLDEVRRLIREQEPLRPSARIGTLGGEALSTATQHRGVDVRRLSQLLRGDLDWIVMKALEKDRTRRYQTARGLAADVQRHLADEPVQARPPTLAHHAAKWARRHRPLVWSTAAVIAIATVAGGALFWTGYRRTAQLELNAGEHLAAAEAYLHAADYAAADRELANVRGHFEATAYHQGPLQEKMAKLAQPLAVIKRFQEFQALRLRIHSEMYALDRAILDRAQEHCRTALDLFAVFQADSWKSQADFENLDTEHQALLDEGAVELLFVWARLEMGKSDAQPAAERAAGHRRAIDALGKIESFHPNIPAVALWLADCWEAIGDQRAAAEARARAESLRPTSAADHYLLGEYHAQHGRLDQALASYWQALARQPDHYLSLLAAGVALGELKEHQSAEAMLTGAIAMNPQTMIAYVKRAAARREQSKLVLALADIEEAKKLDPELANALIRRAGEYRANFQLDKALADYSEAIWLDPKADAYRERGVVYAFQGDLDMALADCNQCVRLEPGSARAYSVRAEIYRLKGDLVRALADANEAIRLDPKSAGTYLVRGRIYGQQRDWGKALTELNEAIHFDPKEAGLFPGRADIYLTLGEREKARADYEEAIRLDPNNVWGHLGLAAFHRDDGDFDKALAEFNEAVRIAPQYPAVYTCRAGFHKDRGDFDKALADYNEAFRLNPNDASTYLLRGQALQGKGDLDRALADYNDSIRIRPSAAAYHWRARVYRVKGDLDLALADNNAAVPLDTKNPWSYSERAQSYLGKNEPDKALADASEAIRLEPGNGAWYGMRGELFLAMREFEKAAADFDRAAGLAPISWHFYKRRAVAHFQLKNYDQALASIAKAVELTPGDFSNLTWLGPTAVAKCPAERLRAGLLELADKTIRWAEDTTDASRPKSFHGFATAAGAYVARAELYGAFGQPDQAEVDFAKAIELEPKNSDMWRSRAMFSVEQAKWDSAAADLSQAVDLKPEQANLWYQRALVRVAAGRLEDYRKDCGEILQRFGQSDKPDDAPWLVWTCALAPDATTNWPQVRAQAEQAVKNDPKSARYLSTLGAVLYRAGQFEEATKKLKEAEALAIAPSGNPNSSPAYTWFFLAMAQQRLQQAEDAQASFDKAVAETDKTLREHEQGIAEAPWNRRLTLKLFREEAESRLGISGPLPVAKEKTRPPKPE
jgi:tetratricopeptide (TPR) repeat protein